MFIKIKEKYRSILINTDKIDSILYNDNAATIITINGEYNIEDPNQVKNLISILNSHIIEV